jgi:hypothetical protein
MRLTRVQAALAAGVVALAGTATAIVMAAVPASATPAAATSSPSVVVVQCSGQGSVKPAKMLEPWCMPSSQYISGLSWTSWQSNAFGSGTFKINTCNPSCAAGKYKSYPILTVLWGAKSWPHHAGHKYFSHLTWIFTGTLPKGVKSASQTVALSPTGAP